MNQAAINRHIATVVREQGEFADVDESGCINEWNFLGECKSEIGRATRSVGSNPVSPHQIKPIDLFLAGSSRAFGIWPILRACIGIGFTTRFITISDRWVPGLPTPHLPFLELKRPSSAPVITSFLAWAIAEIAH